MSKEDLLKSLGLDSYTDVRVKQEVTPSLKRQESVKQDPKRVKEESVIHMDDWDIRKGGEIQAKHKVELSPLEVADFHAATFLHGVEWNEEPQDRRRKEFLDKLWESNDFQMLRMSTVANLALAKEATLEVCQQYIKLLEKDQEQKNCRGGMPRTAEDDFQEEMNAGLCAGRAIVSAAEKVETMEETLEAIGLPPGTGMGKGGNLDQNKLAQIFAKVKNNYRLRSIMERVGKYKRFGRQAQRKKNTHGPDELTGVCLTDQITRLLAEEAMLLQDEVLELDLASRLLEREAVGYEFRSPEPKAKGPIFVCVDESGSMDGTKIAEAKAFCCGMAHVAKHQKRWCGLVGFSGGWEGNFLALPPNKWDQDKFLDWLIHFYGGGTTMDVCMDKVPNQYWNEMGAPKGKTDMIIITDGLVSVRPHLDAFLAWKKKENVRVITIIIYHSKGEFELISDEVHLLSSFNLDQEGVQKCLAI